MYRETKWIGRSLWIRSTPDGEWCAATPEQTIDELWELLDQARAAAAQ